MGYTFLEFMKGIGIFIVCAQSVMHFAAGKSYEKYVKLLIGIMVLAQFVVPIRAILLGHDNAEIFESIGSFQEEIEAAMDSTEITYEDTQLSQSLQEEIKGKLESIANEYDYSIKEAVINENPAKLIIKITALTEFNAESKKVMIDKIKIDSDKDENLVEGQENKNKSADIPDKMINDFSVCLGTDQSYIEIMIE